MGTPTPTTAPTQPILEDELRGALPTFEQFFKTFGFKRVHGRVWGLLVLAGRPLSMREISTELELSQGSTSTTVNELTEWGAIESTFDSSRRCNLHAPVGNALRIVATVFRRREQVAFQQFKESTERALLYIKERYGERDPRVLTLRSIIATCELAEALMQIVLNAVTSALGDPESLLTKALGTVLKAGFGAPARILAGGVAPADARERDELLAAEDASGAAHARETEAGRGA